MRREKGRRGSYIDDYGGPLVDWPGPPDQAEPDWAALFPIPACYRVKEPEPSTSRPRKRSRRGTKKKEATPPPAPASADSDQETDYGDDYDGEFWLSPRMAAQLWAAGQLYVDAWLDQDTCPDYWEDLPAIAQPYAKQKDWWEAYRQAAMRIVGRLEKGLLPKPNCTGEEMALHMIIDNAKESWEDDPFGLVQEMIDPLPASTSSHTKYDHDFDWVSDGAFQDHDVLMLYNTPQLADPCNPVAVVMGAANLHPADWFKPFKPDRISDHVR